MFSYMVCVWYVNGYNWYVVQLHETNQRHTERITSAIAADVITDIRYAPRPTLIGRWRRDVTPLLEPANSHFFDLSHNSHSG